MISERKERKERKRENKKNFFTKCTNTVEAGSYA